MSRARLCVLVVLLLGLECCRAAALPRTFDPRLSDDVMMNPKKRPFCNAFTGCGRKRSQNAPQMPVQEFMKQRQYIDEESLGSRADSESAVEELSRQILSDARLWEAASELAGRQRDTYNYN